MRFWRVGKAPSARITAFLRVVAGAIFLDEAVLLDRAVFFDEVAVCARLVGCMMILED